MRYRKSFCVEPGKRFSLKRVDPDYSSDHAGAKKEMERNRQQLAELQSLLWAEKKHSLLIVLQAMDGGGKDGTVDHVLSAFNPQGATVTGFKAPTAEEAAHDFLWRVHPHAPARGYIAIFNRSHYEDVLAPRVHGTVSRHIWKERYQRIRDFEQLLADNGTRVLKFFLYISREEQLERFAARLKDKSRNWKISESDYAERPHWDDYIRAYEDAIVTTSTGAAPWFVIPSNHKWFRNLAVSQIVADEMEEMKMSYPAPQVDPRKVRREYHHAAGEEKSEAAHKRK